MAAVLMHSEQIAELEQRLETGWQMCEAETNLNQRFRLEDYWITLLKEYEQLVDEERRAQEEQAA